MEQIGAILSRHPRILFHVDAVQSIGKLEIDPHKAGIDLITMSAHKIRGPKGIGALYYREGVQIQPQLAGGGQEFGIRPGTENVPLVVGMAKALRMSMQGQAKAKERLYTGLRVEIREEGAFIYCDRVPGLGGYPLGSSGKAMLMLSGGIDSPVAGWLSMRRGLRIEAVHFHSFPFTSERAQRKVIDLTYKLADYGKSIRLHMVPFTEIQTKLHEYGQPNLLITLTRRAMFRITERLALQEKAGAIVTGESLGQVASQTLASINVIDKASAMPILRPLIMMDKNEIIRIAKQIETYPVSILPYEDCCTLFMPRSPSTNPNLRVVERMESRFEWLGEAIAAAVGKTETINIIHGESTKHDEDLF